MSSVRTRFLCGFVFEDLKQVTPSHPSPSMRWDHGTGYWLINLSQRVAAEVP